MKILLIEGEEALADKLCKILSASQYSVALAIDGSMGKQLFDARRYDLALIDWRLPDINGCELCYYIRGRDGHMPLMMISSQIPDEPLDAFRAGADDYVRLSDDLRELLMRIKVLIRRSVRPVVRESRLAAGDITMDLDSKEVRRKNRPIHLTAREFFLLHYLMRKKNRIVSRDEILFNIWDSRCYAKEGRLAAFIGSLRRKMEGVDDPKCIYTVTGKGYLLDENPR